MNEAERHFQAALGYHQLGLFEDANDEIEGLPPERKVSVEVLQLRASIYMELQAWGLLCGVARFLVETVPGDPQHWVWLACGERFATGLAEARDILVAALQHHPDAATIHYALACCCGRMGETANAKVHLQTAFRLSPDVRLRALDDPDLESIW